jgi:hypothetical protein
MGKEGGKGEGAFGQGGLAALEDFVAHAKEVNGVGRIAPLVVVRRLGEEAEDALELVGLAFEGFPAF